MYWKICRFVLSLVLIWAMLDLRGQTTHQIGFKPQFFQIKEEFNYGLVNDGLNLGVAYELAKPIESGLISYRADIAFGVNYAQGIGMAWQLRPLDGYLGWETGNQNLLIGPYLGVNYQWQLYPELQSGQMFWFSDIELGPRVQYHLNWGGQRVQLTMSNSILGWVSRPAPESSHETYFYSLSASDWIRNVHRDLRFGFNNLFNRTIFEFEWVREGKMSLGYAFEYFGYFENPELRYLSHALTMQWKLGK